MTSKELRDKFLKFFKERGHKIVPSSSLVPQDRTVLLTTAGMQQFVPYLAGKKDALVDFSSKHLVSSQKCFRALDIEEIGDDTHHTLFEMLGNWSIGVNEKGEYFKEGAIKFALDFFVDELGLDRDRFHVTVFKGENDIPKDKEAIKIWEENGISKERIKEFGAVDNFWGPTSTTGPCGPCSEIHYDRGEEYGCKNCGPNCEKCKRFVELWNLVFMEYNKKEDGSFEKLSQTNIDTGIGFERLLSLLNNEDSAYETDLFLPLIKELENLSGKKYKENKKEFRIIVDHIRGACFLIADGVIPSNTEKGYILRRVLRRAIRYGKLLELKKDFLNTLAQKVIEKYKDVYPELESNILDVIQEEAEKFEVTLEKGLKEFEKLESISGEQAFNLYQSYGFPLELTEELAKEKGIKIDKEEFRKFLKKHQKISRAGVEAKFGGVGDRDNPECVKLHTATHLLHQALREVLGEHVQQMGSDITSERLRFDFKHGAKATEEEIKKIEDLVNKKIKEDLEVRKEEVSYIEAIKSGALAFFKEKYPDTVSVYSVGDFSKEICAGPHVKRTSELGSFKIAKEKSASAGIRRIKEPLDFF